MLVFLIENGKMLVALLQDAELWHLIVGLIVRETDAALPTVW
jgi:hypothetical protein